MTFAPAEPCLLIIWHSRTGASEALARAAAEGAGEGFVFGALPHQKFSHHDGLLGYALRGEDVGVILLPARRCETAQSHHACLCEGAQQIVGRSEAYPEFACELPLRNLRVCIDQPQGPQPCVISRIFCSHTHA